MVTLEIKGLSMIKLFLTNKAKKEKVLKNEALEENKFLKRKLNAYQEFVFSLAESERPIGHIGRLSSRIRLDRIILQARRFKDEGQQEKGRWL